MKNDEKRKRVVHIPVNKKKNKSEKDNPPEAPEKNEQEPKEDKNENPTPEEKPEKHDKKAELDADELLDSLQRLKAEYANYQKRTEREMEEYRARCAREIYLKLLPVIDNIERAIASALEHKGAEELLSGVEMILRQFYMILESEEIKPFDSLGEKFDPRFHDAVLLQETDQAEPDTVISEMERGYMMGNRVLRAARVVVSKKPAGKEQPQEDEK